MNENCELPRGGSKHFLTVHYTPSSAKPKDQKPEAGSHWRLSPRWGSAAYPTFPCLGLLYIAEIKHQDQKQQLEEERIYLGLRCLRDASPSPSWEGGVAAWNLEQVQSSLLKPVRNREHEWEVAQVLQQGPPTKLPKQYHQLGTKCSTMWVCGECPHPNHYTQPLIAALSLQSPGQLTSLSHSP